MQHSKKHLYLAHGWGMPSVIWKPILQELSQHFHVHLIDLPGYGENSLTHNAYDSFEYLAQSIIPQIQHPGIWCGWSLSGMLGIVLAKMLPEKLQGLVTIASNVKFIQDEDWMHAVSKDQLIQFSNALNTDYHSTINRFLILQMHGSDHAKSHLKLLKAELNTTKSPCSSTLNGGLNLLFKSDLRKTLSQLSTKILMLFGRADKLVPYGVVADLEKQYPQIQTVLMQGAAHAPFLSHPNIFIDHLNEFCYANP